MNKALFLGVIIGGTFLSWILLLLGIKHSSLELMYLSYIPSLASLIFWSILVYKMWFSIQGDHARTTPGKAVGFMFIPFFNIYWIWIVIVGFAQDFNNYIQANKPGLTPLNVNLFMAQVILLYCTIIPIIGQFMALGSLVLTVINLNKVIDGVNALQNTDPYQTDPYQAAIST